jgi:hypothetical protein
MLLRESASKQSAIEVKYVGVITLQEAAAQILAQKYLGGEL